jgi:Putative transmembrane protein (PGPGW)
LRRAVVGVIGGTIVLVGVALIVLPGPAVIVIPLGLWFLAVNLPGLVDCSAAAKK